MPEAHDPYAALRCRDYRLLLAGGVLASVGGEIEAVAVGWELYQRTHSAAALGFAGLAQFLPVLLLALPAGQAADRYSRRLLFQLAQATAAVACVGPGRPVVLARADSLWFISAWSWRASPAAFSAPARSSLLPQVVPPEALGNAVTWNSSGWQFANVAGPAVGGADRPHGRTGGASYVLAALCALVVRRAALPRPAADGSPPAPATAPLASLFAGVHFVWRTELLLAAITLDLFAVLLGGATALLPIYAQDILHVGAVGLGWLRAAPALGAVVMALVLAHRPPLRRPGRALLLAVAGFGAATIVFGFSREFLAVVRHAGG